MDNSDLIISLPDGPIRRAGEIRIASRAVLYREENICLLWVPEDNIFKLPGGGARPGETLEEALKRECREEVGAEITDIQELGLTVENRSEEDRLQLSWCFTASVKGPLTKRELTSKEEEEGREVQWLAPELAVKKMAA